MNGVENMPSIRLREIFSKNDENKLVLPDFQRDFVWDKEQQRNLLASFLTYLPVGSILLLQGKKGDFANKRMCFPKESCNPKDECIYLLDGQQRITSLKSIFTDLFLEQNSWRNTWDNIYKNLRNRWFIRVIPKDDEEDIFGYKKLKFKGLKCYEPNEVINYIEYKQIFKTKTQDWFNPGFIIKDRDGNIISNDDINLRNLYIREYAVKEGLVPMFTIYNENNGKPLHQYVIENIGIKRTEIIKAEINDIGDKLQRNEEIKKYLKDIEPNIDIFLENDEDTSVNSAWSNLSAKWSRDIINYLEGILDEEISTIELPASEINRAVSIFESINKGGTPLNTYDLIVAKAAKDKSLKSLSKRLLGYLQKSVNINNAISSKLHEVPNKWYPKYIKLINDNELTSIVKNQFLNMLSIFSYVEYGQVDNIKIKHIKRNRILNLSAEDINKNTEKAVKSLIRASAFLQLRCGIVELKELPYELMILPIAYCLIDNATWNDTKRIDQIEYWYWSCLFGGAYRERQNDQCIKDIKNLYKWINGFGENKFQGYNQKVLNEPGYSDEDLLLMKDETHEIPKAIRKGILQYILSTEPKDLLYEDLYLTAWKVGAEEEFQFKNVNQVIKLEDHHICPLKSVAKMGQSSKELRGKKNFILNSPLNRTYISSVSNKEISDMDINKYLQYVSKVSRYNHCLPDFKKEFEKLDTDKDGYKNILISRYNDIYKQLILELDSLKLR